MAAPQTNPSGKTRVFPRAAMVVAVIVLQLLVAGPRDGAGAVPSFRAFLTNVVHDG
ncbi:hypothetical protein GCM10009677_48150 [Sphaerisporangium rubeum]